MSTESTMQFDSVTDLLDASMDDLDDLPPVGAPPSGHYNLLVSMEVRKMGTPEKDVICADFEVEAVNELKEGEDPDPEEVKEGQKFTIFYHSTKKDGTTNTFGIGKMKQFLAPFATRFGTRGVGETINAIKEVHISATVVRKVNKMNEDQYNVNIKDIDIL